MPSDVVKQARKLSASDLSKHLTTKSHSNEQGSEYSLSIQHASKLSTALRGAVFDAFEGNMREMYEASENGYDPAEKRNELFDNASRFLLAKIGTSLQGYAMFRFEWEPDRQETMQPVLYCYEIQILPKARGKKLGRHLMECLLSLAVAFKMTKVMLTVFENNSPAIGFYTSIGYTKDETSPCLDLDGQTADYIIMSKAPQDDYIRSPAPGPLSNSKSIV